MNITQVAADIAARIPAMVNDSPINNAHLIETLLEPHALLDHALSPEVSRSISFLEQLRGTIEKLEKERDLAQAKLREAEAKCDDEWLAAIGKMWMKLTGQPWETRDGETRDEGLQSNIAALFQEIEDGRKAQAKCSEMRNALVGAQWCRIDGFCPECSQHSDIGHAENCTIRAALEKLLEK